MLLCFALLTGGFAALCCAMPRHTRQALPNGNTIMPVVFFRISGWLAMLLALLVATNTSGTGVGLVWFFALLPVAAGLLAALLNLAPRLVPLLVTLPPLVWLADSLSGLSP